MSNISNPLEDQIKRSASPPPSEKVLLYLEGMARVGGAFSRPPSSIASMEDDEPVAHPNIDTNVDAQIPIPTSPRAASHVITRSPAASRHSALPGNAGGGMGSAFGGSVRGSMEPGGGNNADDDAHSIEQVGQRSRAPTINDEEPGPHYASFGSFGNLNAAQFNESGPSDEPKPHYVSGTSSFGNMGPLPSDNPADAFRGWNVSNRTPMFAAGVPLPAESTTMSPRQNAQRTPMAAAGIPLPAGSVLMSPKSTAAKSTSVVNIEVQAPTPPYSNAHGGGSRVSKTASVASRRSDVTERNGNEPVIPFIPPQLRTQDFADAIDANEGSSAPHEPPLSPRARVQSPPSVRATSPPHAQSKAFSPRSNTDRNLFSPKSNASRALSNKPPQSHAGTHYPALPASNAGSMQYSSSEDPLSPQQRTFFGQSQPFPAPSAAQSARPPASVASQNNRSTANPQGHDTFSPTSTQNGWGFDNQSQAPSQNLNQGPPVLDVRSTSPFGGLLGSAISAVAHELAGFTHDIQTMRQAVTGSVVPPAAPSASASVPPAPRSIAGFQSERATSPVDQRPRTPAPGPGPGPGTASVDPWSPKSATKNVRDNREALFSPARSTTQLQPQPPSSFNYTPHPPATASIAPSHHSIRELEDALDGEEELDPEEQLEEEEEDLDEDTQDAELRHLEEATPTPSRPHSPDPDADPVLLNMNEEEQNQILSDLLKRKAGTRTSYATSALGAEIDASPFHDQELCILLHAADDPMTHDVVRRVVKKAIRNRMKNLKMKYDPESIQTFKQNFHDHDPSWHDNNPPNHDQEAPSWAKDIIKHLTIMEERVAALGPKIESLISPNGSHSRRTRSHSHRTRSYNNNTNGTPQTQESHLRGQMTGDDSMYRPPDTVFTPIDSVALAQTLPGSMHHHDGSDHGEEDEFEDENANDDDTQGPTGQTRSFLNRTPPTQDGIDHSRHHHSHRPYGRLSASRIDSPGQQYFEEELYKLRVRNSSQSQATHRSWEIAREGVEDDADDEAARQTTVESELPEIVGSTQNGHDAAYNNGKQRAAPSPPLPPLPTEANTSREVVDHAPPTPWVPPTEAWTSQESSPPPWQRIHQRLLNWAIVWPVSELDAALNSTNRGFQIDEVALSIWSTQQYKRYVRNQLTEVPPGRVDRLFVPPNIADAINNAVFHGRHGDACGMLRDLWAPFGLEGMPRIIIVLCKHRGDANHWVAHKFSLPDGTLTTYDTYPEKSLPDGRPLGWWFAIRIAWPNAMYPSPDHLMQKMVRLHRPMQLAIDNSVAAAGIWRNLLMSSRAERPLDLERLRDLINTEVKNLRQRKEQGKLSVSATRPKWEMAM